MKPALFVTALILLTGCDAGAEQRRQTMDDAEERAVLVSPTPVLSPSGEAQSLSADEDVFLPWSASVVRVDYLDDQEPTAKLFGLAGGDPAMNGLYTYLAFFESPASGWRVFRLGDFLDYRVIGEGENRVDLELDYSVMDPDTDEITSATRRIIVTWTPGPEGEGPAAIAVADAR